MGPDQGEWTGKMIHINTGPVLMNFENSFPSDTITKSLAHLKK